MSVYLRVEMEDNKGKAYIKQQAAAKKVVAKEGPKGMGLAHPSSKRKPSKKTNRPPKNPKVVPESVIGLKAEPKKMATPLGQGRGKGLMTGHVPMTEKSPILLREKSWYVLE